MNINEVCSYAFVNSSTVEFSRSLNQLFITVTMFPGTSHPKKITQALPLDHHIEDKRVKECISYCIDELKKNN